MLLMVVCGSHAGEHKDVIIQLATRSGAENLSSENRVFTLPPTLTLKEVVVGLYSVSGVT